MDKLVQELIDNEQYDLADAIADMTPTDAANYIAANKAYFTKVYNSDDLEQMPLFRKALYSNIKTDKVNYDEAFGEGWYNNFNDIPLDQIKYVAEQRGEDWKEFLNNMSAEATQRVRHDIAYGEDQGGWLESPLRNLGGAAMHVFAPRQQEAIERGEDPSTSDVVLDAAQNALYAIPYGSAMKFVSNPAVRTGFGALLSNAGAPLATEALDYAVYDKPNPRGTFEWGDVGTGTGVNLVGGALLRGAGMGIGRIAPKVRDFLGELATGKTAKEAVDEVRKQYKFNVNVANDPTVPQAARQKAQEMVKLMETDPELYAAISTRDPVVFNVAEQEGTTLTDKANAYIKSNKLDANTVLSPEGSGPFEPVKDKFINRTSNYSPVTASLTKAYDKLGLGTATEGLKTAKQLAGEEALKNYITNEFGNIQDEQGRALARFPLIGPAIQKMREEEAKKKAEHEENMRILDELRAKGLLHSER